jgi:hypothetical protein
MDKPKPNKVAQFYSGQIRQNGALLLRRLAQFCSGVDNERPKLTCQVQRTASHIALYDYQKTDCRIAFEKSY